MPREKWDPLVRGEGCELCDYIAGNGPEFEHGYTVGDLGFSRLFLHRNQYVPGYCVLVCKKHVREPFELTKVERQSYFEDLSRTGEVLEKLFGSIKMNFQVLGNTVPHLHCHIVPRYYGDPAPGRPIDPLAKKVLLSSNEYRQRVDNIIRALETLK